MINGANKIVGKGVAKMDISVSVYQGTVYADVTGDIVLLVVGPKLEETAGVWLAEKLPIFTKLSNVPGAKVVIGFLSLEPIKNGIVSLIDKWGG
ncbi:hypothetical protein JCM16138_09450 [Thermococcus atlanticus]